MMGAAALSLTLMRHSRGQERNFPMFGGSRASSEVPRKAVCDQIRTRQLSGSVKRKRPSQGGGAAGGSVELQPSVRPCPACLLMINGHGRAGRRAGLPVVRWAASIVRRRPALGSARQCCRAEISKFVRMRS